MQKILKFHGKPAQIAYNSWQTTKNICKNFELPWQTSENYICSFMELINTYVTFNDSVEWIVENT